MRKLLGILGGMGPQATVRFYDLVVRESIQRAKGPMRNADFPHMLINNIPVPDLVKSTDDEEQTVRMIEAETRRLADAGCTHLAMPCNTMHLYADRIRRASGGLPFISMIDAVVERLSRDKVRSVALLGSLTTMKSALYTEPLSAAGIRVDIPDATDRETIGELIHAAIAGKIEQAHSRAFRDIVKRLGAKADAVLLGCTELPILAEKCCIPESVRIVDSPAILARACSEVIAK